MRKLLEFDYTIEYKRGAENTAADALSRNFQDEHLQTAHLSSHIDSCLAISSLVPSWINVKTPYENDPHCIKLLQELSINKDNNKNFTLQSSILRYKGKKIILAQIQTTIASSNLKKLRSHWLKKTICSRHCNRT
jgi:hypothetical protein